MSTGDEYEASWLDDPARHKFQTAGFENICGICGRYRSEHDLPVLTPALHKAGQFVLAGVKAALGLRAAATDTHVQPGHPFAGIPIVVSEHMPPDTIALVNKPHPSLQTSYSLSSWVAPGSGMVATTGGSPYQFAPGGESTRGADETYSPAVQPTAKVHVAPAMPAAPRTVSLDGLVPLAGAKKGQP